jgi:hypothetical protein
MERNMGTNMSRAITVRWLSMAARKTLARPIWPRLSLLTVIFQSTIAEIDAVKMTLRILKWALRNRSISDF